MTMEMKNQMNQEAEIQIIVRSNGHVEIRYDPRNEAEEELVVLARPWVNRIAANLRTHKGRRRLKVISGGRR